MWNSVLEAMHWQGLSVGLGSTDNRLRIRESVEWMVCHSDRVSLSETITCNHQLSESEWWGFFIERIWMYRFGKFTNIWNFVCRQYCTYHQCCAALSCIATPVSYCNYRTVSLRYCRLNGKTILALGKILKFFHIKETSLNTSEMFQVKKVVFWIVMGSKGWHNANLILIWYAKVSLSPKYRCWNLTNALPVYRHRFCL